MPDPLHAQSPSAPEPPAARPVAPDDAAPGPTLTSKTMARGLRLLRLLADHPDGLSVRELAAALDTHRAAIYRLLTPLAEHRLIARSDAGRYRLGVGLVELAGRVAPRLQAVAEPHLRDLADELAATAYLTLMDGDDAVSVTVVEPRHTRMHVAYRVGVRHPLAVAASGMAILAGRDEVPGERPEVTRARRRGYVVSQGELQAGAVGLAAPLRLGGRAATASVGMVTLGVLDEARVAPAVLATAAAIGQALD
jgi:DNA-binding IclR family transcriptional regulator